MKLIRNIFILLLTLLLSLSSGSYADLRFVPLPSTGSSGYSSVGGFAQDKQGYIWCVLGFDILRYDGYVFRSYNDKITGQDDWRYSYYSIVYTHTGRLFVCTSRGLYAYQPETDDFGLVYNGVYRSVYEDGLGRLWLTSNAPVCYDPHSGMVTPLQIGGKQQTGQFFTAPDIGQAFFITNDSLYTINFLEDKSEQCAVWCQVTASSHAFLNSHITAITVCDSTLYVLTSHKGLFSRSITAGVDEPFLHLTNVGDVNTRARLLTHDREGQLWIGTMQGLFVYDPRTGSMRHYSQTMQRGSLVNNSVQAVFFDRADNLWVGTYAGGLCYAPMHSPRCFRQCRQHDYGYISLPVSYMLADGAKLWYGTEGDGVFCYEEGKGITAHYNTASRQALTSDNIKAIYKSGDDLWLATYLGGINRLNTRTEEITVYGTRQTPHHLISDQIYNFCPDADGALWIIYQDLGNIVTRLDLATGEQTSYDIPAPPAKNASARLLYITRAGDRLWLGTTTSLHCFSITDRQHLFSVTPEQPVQIYSLCYDSLLHSLWLGTYSHGLIRYDIDSNTFLSPVMEKELKDVAVRDIVAENGRLWLGTNKGIFSYNIAEQTAYYYNSYDDTEGTVFSAALSTDSEGSPVVYMGGVGTWTVIRPGSIVYNTLQPKVLFSDIYINNISIYDASSPDSLKIGDMVNNKLRLRHNENNITVTLSCTNFTLSEKNRFRFRLLSKQRLSLRPYKQEPWHEADAQHRVINLMQMTPGHYLFEAQACNNDGIWGETSALDIQIKPVFYLSLTAKIIYLLVALALLTFIIWSSWRHYRLRRELYQSQIRQQEEEKASRAKVLFFTDVNKELKAPLLTLQTLVRPEHVPYVQQMLTTMDTYTRKYCIDTGTNPVMTQQQQQLDKLTAMIGDRIQDGHIDIDQLAVDMGMSRRKLFSFVKEMTGKAPVEYIRSYRLQTAAKLMLERGMTVKEAMDSVGIESQSYFVKSFREEFGDTPAAFVSKQQSTFLPK